MGEGLAGKVAAQEGFVTTETVIRAQGGWRAIDLKKLWQYRELLYFLTWRDIKIRYKQTVLGCLWAFMQPFLKMVVFSVIFGNLAGMDSGDVPYPIFLYSALLPWQFFAESLTRSSQSVVASPDLITKVFFPRLIIPLSSVGACLVDFAISFLILIGLMLYYGTALTAGTLMVLPLVLLTIVAAVGVGSFLSALNVAYRDFRYVIPFMVQIWMFLTPVIYPTSMFKDYQWVLSLNPMTGIVDGYRWAILGTPFAWGNLGISVAVTAVAFYGGAMYFRRIERQFADMI